MTGAQVGIRLVEPADAEQLAAIYGPHCTDGIASFETVAPSVDDMAERVRTRGAELPWLVAVASGDVIGYAYASRHRERAAYRWSVDVSVYVSPTAAGRGVGRALYDRLLALLAAQGFHRAYAGIALPNEASQRLHRAVGFEPVGVYREVGWKHGAWVDVQWWSRTLANPTDPAARPLRLDDLPLALLADLRKPNASLGQ
jgi:L-amino acid N-acyltransferase YncA